jgi:hypothetical protein
MCLRFRDSEHQASFLLSVLATRSTIHCSRLHGMFRLRTYEAITSHRSSISEEVTQF